MNSKTLTRRRFVTNSSTLAVGSLGLYVGLYSTGCKETQARKTKPNAEGFTCTDVTGLTPDQVAGRKNLKYVDQTRIPSKRCDNCNLWLEAQMPDEKCGGCKIMKGPVHPAGFCTAWAPGVMKKS